MFSDGDAGLRFCGGLSAWENYFQNVQLPSLFEGFVLQLHIFYQKERIKAFVFAFKFVFVFVYVFVFVNVEQLVVQLHIHEQQEQLAAFSHHQHSKLGHMARQAAYSC